MAQKAQSIEDLRKLVGVELGCSDWVRVDQEMIDAFANITGDHQWIHVDEARARAESPFGATIAHGYLTVSLVTRLSYEIGAWPDHLGAIINYGIDRLRFLAPVKVGSQVRLRSSLKAVEDRPDGSFLLRNDAQIEIEGVEKPALVVESLVLLVPKPDV
ncbi:MaoC family dehydratase [Nitratireductor basaltis]|uniref:Enoyl-CoA hydratase n=1 Tax=Nitratireductor basaltis TaxID=472175 RepID=A0A084UA37_9HYPH|nr:MaoC family dehydratase [Nitratireductor basaltis]KFB09823.1 Enoyl-CoA hydratase [Nitratireductor basaltis]